MTPKERIALICESITHEQDPVEFQRLLVELLDLLEHVAPEKKNDSKATRSTREL